MITETAENETHRHIAGKAFRGVIWNFVYAVKPADAPQIGLLNSIVVGLGGKPEAWTAFNPPWNNFFLIAIVIWLQTGYSMVLFSAAPSAK